MNTHSQRLVRRWMASHLGNLEAPIEDATTFDQLGLDTLDRALVALRIEDVTGADGHLFIHALDHSKTVGDLSAPVDQSALPSPAAQPDRVAARELRARRILRCRRIRGLVVRGHDRDSELYADECNRDRADRQDYAVNSEQAEVEHWKPPQLSVRLVSPQRRSSAPQLSRAP